MADTATTSYVILENHPEAVASWSLVTRIEARSAAAALREHGRAGRFVAVPARSWKPYEFEAETVTRLTLKSPGP